MDLVLPEFSFAFQPIVDVSAGKIESFEALVRGINGEPAAQVFQKVHESNKYSFDEILRLRALPFALDLGINSYLNLNLLPRSLEVSKTAISSIIKVAEELEFPISHIVLEVTESETIRDPIR